MNEIEAKLLACFSCYKSLFFISCLKSGDESHNFILIFGG